MTTAIPEGRTAAVPYLSVRGGARAIDFYVTAFGAAETMRLSAPDGKIGHAELSIGSAQFMVADEYPDIGFVGPETLGGTSVAIHLYVADVDTFTEGAVRGGAKVLRPLADQFYGDRTVTLQDPFGHRWTFASRFEEVAPEELERRAATAEG